MRTQTLWIFIALVFILNLMLVSPSLMPTFDELNVFDEVKYIDSGRSLANFQVRDISWAPLVSIIYLPLHWIFQGNPNWLLIEAWLGRFILFTFMWFSIQFLAFRFTRYTNPLVTTGILFVSLAMFPALENQSDALYIAISALALGLVSDLLENHRLATVRRLSLLSGLAVLVRVEAALVLFAIIVLLAVLEWKRHNLLHLSLSLLAPAAGVLVIYLLGFGLSTGGFSLSSKAKAWEAFEANQPIRSETGRVIISEGTDPAARQETHRLFGTAEENDQSVLKAVIRNPKAFANRVFTNIFYALPQYFFDFFGKRAAPLIFLFSILGVASLLKSREWIWLSFALIWLIPAIISLAFLPRHLVPQLLPVIFLFTSIGVSSVIAMDKDRRNRLRVLVLVLMLSVYSLFDQKPAFLVAGLVVTGILLIVLWAEVSISYRRSAVAWPYLLLLAGALILREPYRFPNLPELGSSPRELAAHYLQDNLPAGSKVLASVPITAIAAGMMDVRNVSDVDNLNSDEELYKRLRSEGIRAILLDEIYPLSQVELGELISEGIGTQFVVGYQAPSSPVQVLLLAEDSP